MPNKNRKRLAMQSAVRSTPTPRVVRKIDRYGPTPETVEKLKRDYLQDLLARDPAKDGDGIDHHEVEDLLEIELAWTVIEAELGGASTWTIERSDGGGSHDMSDGAARLWAIWNLWAKAFEEETHYKGNVMAMKIRARDPVPDAGIYLFHRAARLWDLSRYAFDKSA